ncbi:MAG TPA: protein-methionine-sulfoxide reductase catalytic subunit MsrP [Anaerolineales bacterium]|nr:protein-methionine-sulfoxide reductase catalytic subunit MsrP [Anaerolineales bacterium]
MSRRVDFASPPSSEITPRSVYLSRRAFLTAAGLAGLGAAVAACAPRRRVTATPGPSPSAGASTDDLGDPLTSFDDITHFNNYYEFSTSKEAVADRAAGFPTRPWTVEVGGLVHKPQTFAIDDLLKSFDQEERIYRLRCVEAWSMVIPWLGFALGKLIDQVEPMTSAAFVGFTSVLDPEDMPGQSSPFYPWPYTEGLRVDEARHPLAILASGLYGESLPPQDGAPLRLVVPWKYGFKSIKAIVRIDLLEKRPATLWNTVAPNEYGFYSNVNPQVDHPRWSQASERRIGESGRRETLMFNGYADQVAGLYSGMDLKANY